MLSRLLEAWTDPSMRHAMLVHFPIVLSLIGLPFLLLGAILKRRQVPALWTALALYAALAAAAGAAKLSGERAEESVEGSLDETGETLLEEHEERAEWVWVFALGVAALTGAGLAPVAALRRAAPWVAAAGGLFVAGWVADTADHGGRLVYEHGAGTKAKLSHLLAPDAGDPALSDPRLAFFRETVRPILADNCLRCHNPQRAERAGGLDQTSLVSLLEGGHSGRPAVVPGKPAESFLIAAVRHQVPDFEMPRGEEPLPPDAIAALERWITEGAVWEPIAAPANGE